MELLLHFELIGLLAVYSLVAKCRVGIIIGASWVLFLMIGVLIMGEDMPKDFYRYADGVSVTASFLVILRIRKYILSTRKQH